ncbi:MAG: DUF3237 domain-containing protein, partial [Ottowia sp.]|nr:DUF3237 domain-containing protein [Ottowia sp.]
MTNTTIRALARSAAIGAALVAAALATGCTAVAQPRPETAQAAAPNPASIPVVLPRTELVYEAIAELAPTLELGVGPLGERRMVPITGGSFQGPRL